MNEEIVSVITGARKGIGRELAEYYCGKGYQVIGISRGPSDLKDASYEHFECDVSDEKAVQETVLAIRQKYKQVHHLINNAGVASMNHLFTTPGSTVRRIFETNFYGTFHFCREISKIMSRSKFGRIVNFSTVAVPLNIEGEAVYAASKAAVETFSRVLARELSSFGITVNTLGPCPLKSDLIKSVPEEKLSKIIDQQAIKTFCTAADVARVIDFFLDPENKLVTGQTIYLGGVF